MKRIMPVAGAIVTMIESISNAALYDVARTFTSGTASATLTGTVTIPEGSYTIMNGGESYFTAVNLTLTVNGAYYALLYADTTFIHGTAQFFINATPTTLSFNMANSDGENPADLLFLPSADAKPPSWYSNVYPPNYVIGFDASPSFEAAYTDAGNVVSAATFPTVFGTVAVPEPSAFILEALLLLTFGLPGIRNLRNRK